MLSKNTQYSDDTFVENTAQLMVTHPQIINGGQTAFTLSRLFEETISGDLNIECFAGKEVLLKIITLPTDEIDDKAHRELIETISNATNHQTPIDEADRRSNDSVQLLLQEKIYEKYGYFYERKRGEYADGIRNGYVQRSQIIDREIFIRLCKACDLEPSEARRTSRSILFESKNFNNTLKDPSRYQEYFFAFKCWEVLSAIERGFSRDRNNRHGIANFGSGLVYGKYAIISACKSRFEGDLSLAVVGKIVDDILGQWKKFEAQVITKKSESKLL